ncbi:RCC1 domain-containing protein [Adhaeribacter rhizoryzae]|uniref:RCC1-like domain-containing protein n=1 Tax=Adhaeribacter rhizoryzae TaxID=2607907 RepID=A0A5M6CUX9_9BACT|nr:hypothetical protein [Adhaeribacter rhizoryzae]KAA5538863.1 hypothetical protein F0145_25505 [Adhaeribacter rhizoryzae]
MSIKTIKIFIASSAELKADRDEFRLFISKENDRLHEQGIYLKILQWEHFLDAISDTRLQDEYNQAIRKCDIMFCLFFTKVGKYTDEEFDTAYQCFKDTGKPKIWTYFKQAPVDMSSLTEEISTLFSFKKKLLDLGHFPAVYINIDNLKYKFRGQLDEILPQFVGNNASIEPKADESKASKIELCNEVVVEDTLNFHYNPQEVNRQHLKELINGRFRKFAWSLAHGGGGISQSSYAISADGKVYGWGGEDNGELGNGTSNSATPVDISGYGALAGKTIVTVATGRNYKLALDSDGKVYVWGGNNGALPLEVSDLSDITAIAVGDAHSLALKSDGTVYAWGAGGEGQLGDGHFEPGSYAVPFRGSTSLPVGGLLGVIAISAGANHSLAVKSDGTVYAWGDDSYGQLGNGYIRSGDDYLTKSTASAVPEKVNALFDVIAVAGGSHHSIGLKSDGSVYTWGNAGYGPSTSKKPVQVTELSEIIAIASGTQHSLALKLDGTVYTWGYGEGGQLGNGTYSSSSVPVQVKDLSDVTAIAGGLFHSQARKLDGTVYAWGGNNYGQLGSSASSNSAVPVLVPISLKPTIETISLPSNVFYVGQKDILVGFITESITAENYDQREVYIAQLSNSTGSFSSPVTIGTGVSYSGYYWQISCSIPDNTPLSTGYRIRVINSKTNLLGLDNGSNLTIYASRASINWQVLEDFERPNPWPWLPWRTPGDGSNVSGVLSPYVANFGQYGINIGDWAYRADVMLGNPGDKISLWVKDSASLGFQASPIETHSFAIGNNRITFNYLERYLWYPYRQLSAAEFINQPDIWYRLEVTFCEPGFVEGRVYDSDGITELAFLKSRYYNRGLGGIAMKGRCMDDITYYLGPS